MAVICGNCDKDTHFIDVMCGGGNRYSSPRTEKHCYHCGMEKGLCDRFGKLKAELEAERDKVIALRMEKSE